MTKLYSRVELSSSFKLSDKLNHVIAVCAGNLVANQGVHLFIDTIVYFMQIVAV